MYYVYVLKSLQKERYYIGCTKSLNERVGYHNRGSAIATKAYRPWTLIAFVKYDTLSEARRRESYLKSLKNPKYMLQIMDS